MPSHAHATPSCRAQSRLALVGLSVLAWPSGALSASAQESTNAPPLAVWDVSTTASTGGGYRGNVLLSSFQPEGSSFIEMTADFSAIRLSETGSTLTLFVLGELRRYLESEEAPNEGFLYALARVEKPDGMQNTIGGEFAYLYQNQVLDASETEQVFRRLGVTGHSLSLKPGWEHELSEEWTFSLVGAAVRQIYEAELDDYWEGLARIELAHAYGFRSSVALAYELRHRFYDTRVQYDLTATPISGSDLVYRYHEIAGEWRHYWAPDRRWRTTLKAGFLRNDDNGAGYFDYDRVQLSAQTRWRQGPWEATAQARVGWYWYPNQVVLEDERNRAFYALDARIEFQIDTHWLLYAAAAREWNLSNNPLEEYNDWFASGGIGVEL